MEKIIMALLGFVLVSAFTPIKPRINPRPIIVLTGQSNMVASENEIEARMTGYDFVECAVNGSSIAAWQRGQSAYEDCLAAVNLAKLGGGEVVGILHFQGESDTINQTVALQWMSLTHKFFNTFRHDIGYPNIPVVFAQLGATPSPGDPWPYWDFIHDVAPYLLVSHPTLRMIPTDDIEPHCPPGDIHWCLPPASPYKVIAQRFVTEFRAYP